MSGRREQREELQATWNVYERETPSPNRHRRRAQAAELRVLCRRQAKNPLNMTTVRLTDDSKAP